jgi:hypothetical protein
MNIIIPIVKRQFPSIEGVMDVQPMTAPCDFKFKIRHGKRKPLKNTGRKWIDMENYSGWVKGEKKVTYADIYKYLGIPSHHVDLISEQIIDGYYNRIEELKQKETDK